MLFGLQTLCLQPASHNNLLTGKHFPGSLLLAVVQSGIITGIIKLLRLSLIKAVSTLLVQGRGPVRCPGAWCSRRPHVAGVPQTLGSLKCESGIIKIIIIKKSQLLK